MPVAKCGGRVLNENTTKLLNSLFLLLTETPENLAAMSMKAKCLCHEDTKKRFQAFSNKLPQPGTHIVKLPADPKDFKAQYADMYAEAFGGQDPAPCRLSMAALNALNISYPCRPGPQCATVVPSVPTDEASMKKFIVGMMQHVSSKQVKDKAKDHDECEITINGKAETP